MIREAYRSLSAWKDNPGRKPLIIQGARQVGKTWLMREFGSREFAHTAYFNFESTKEVHGIFRQDLDVNRILMALGILSGKKPEAGTTLIIFDEIQACPEAVTALKYFQENAPGLHVIAAGSLLGVAMHRGLSFPVGKVDFLDLHPMGFHEFIRSTGNTPLLEALLSGEMNAITLFE
ncbi:MAG: ATP-binding protein, partial [Bacteroidota bacterium]